MIIDFHTHTFPDPIADAAIDRLSRQANITAYTCGTAAGLLLAERAAGVDRSIILPVATKPEQVHHINDYAAAHNKHAFVTNMFSFGCIHPDYEDWKQELDRLAAANMRGVKIHPAYQQTDLDDPKYLRILERAGALGLIVVTHAGYDIGFPGCACCTPEKARSALRQVGPVKLVLALLGAGAGTAGRYVCPARYVLLPRLAHPAGRSAAAGPADAFRRGLCFPCPGLRRGADPFRQRLPLGKPAERSAAHPPSAPLRRRKSRHPRRQRQTPPRHLT